MKRLSFIICLLGMVACQKEANDQLSAFYTHEARAAQNQNEHSDIPMPKLVDYYSTHNFVVDSLGGLYYFHHDAPIVPGCGTGLSEDSYPARFIGLRPENLIKIPSSGVDKFVKGKILKDTVSDNLIVINVASEKDTFHSRDVSKVCELINKKVRLISIRRTTQEESEVLNNKKRKIPYDYHSVKWDSARTTFRKNY